MQIFFSIAQVPELTGLNAAERRQLERIALDM